MNRTILIALGLLAALLTAAGIMHYHQPVNQKINLFPIVENGKCGYIDNTGKVIVAPQFYIAYDFYDGMAQIGIHDETGDIRMGYIDQNGNIAIKPQFGYLDSENFSEGLAAVRERIPINDSYEDKWGYINKKGEMAIKPQFYEAGPFTKGIALVDTINDGWSTGQKYIDKTGRFVEKPDNRLNPTYEFSEGLAVVCRDSEMYYIDKTGKVVIRNPKFDWCYPFSDGLALVDTKEGPIFIDKIGKVVISNPSFQCGFPFSEGLAAVRVRESFKFGYIDKTGNFVIPPQFEYAYSFTNGIAKVELGNKYGIGSRYQFAYIDKTGKYVWGPSAIPPEVIGTPKPPETPEDEIQKAKEKK